MAITHSEPADENFTPRGRAAWNAGHTVISFDVGTTSSAGSIFFPSRTAGRGQQGIISYDVTFSGTVDPNISIGYNLAADGSSAQAGEPQGHMAIEGNYNDGSGQNKMEAYFQWSGLPGQGASTYRPWFTVANRTTGGVTNQFFADVHQFGGKSAASASGMDVYADHVDFVGGQSGIGNFFTVSAATTGNTPILQVAGFDTNVNAGWSSKGAGGHIFYTGAASRVVMVLNNIASSVNFLDVIPAASTGTVQLRAAGSDNDVAIAISSKGTDPIRLFTNTTGAEQVNITHTASANRFVTLTGSNGANPAISVSAGELAVGTNAWTFGVANSVSPTSPDRTLTVTIGGTTYYIHAKTTNN